jgi:hypothetical protein
MGVCKCISSGAEVVESMGHNPKISRRGELIRTVLPLSIVPPKKKKNIQFVCHVTFIFSDKSPTSAKIEKKILPGFLKIRCDA